ncbi:MAG: MBOAT family O-acyltransferase [Acetatifactor sp.]
MVFDSVTFLFRFFPVFMVAYYLIPKKCRNLLLFLGSLFVCSWGSGRTLLILMLSVLTNYMCGLLLDNLKEKKSGKLVLFLALCLNLWGLMFGAGRSIVALSFWAIHGISYCMDVYSGRTESFMNPIHLGVYLTFFPVWMAGPILQYSDMEAQIRHRSITPEHVKDGLKRICFGLTKKVFLGDRCGALWGEILHRGVENCSAGTAWLGAIAFLMWLYFTFSGYADLAVGLAKMLGFTIRENFHRPAFSVSVTDFCNRFLCSVSAFLKRVLFDFFDLEHKNRFLQCTVALLAGGIAGIWLQKSLSALLCGLFLAFFLCLEKIGLSNLLEALSKPIRMLYTDLIVLAAGVVLGVSDVALVLPYGKSLLGLGGLVDREFFFLSEQYLVYLIVGAVVASGVLDSLVEKIRESKSGLGMAIYRFGEIAVPAVCLLWTLIWAVGTGYPEFVFSF